MSRIIKIDLKPRQCGKTAYFAELEREAKKDYRKQPKSNQNKTNSNMGRKKKGERK